jgi:uncharacterized cofD-like protein
LWASTTHNPRQFGVGGDRPVTGPAVVAVGGGHGLAVTLRACAPWAGSLTAVVSVADDGGSSGRIRTSTDLPAPGDLRRCLTALADPGRATLAAALERRFSGGDLDGHPAGNVLLAALAVELGDLAAAVLDVGELLGVADHVTVVPSTTTAVDLVGTLADGSTVRGQVAVEEAGGVEQVRVEPREVLTPAAATDAVAHADLVVLGPGSLYGSVLAAAVVPDVADALAKSVATSAFVCNLRPRPPETDGYDVAAHVAALRRHGVDPDVVVVHDGALPLGELTDVEVVVGDVAHPHGRSHDPTTLGEALRGLL